MTEVIVLYHSPCHDGFAAAWVARKHILEVGKKATCYPVSFGNPPPWDLIRGKEVYIVDFSYSKEITKQIINETSSLTIIDHHKTAQEELKEFSSHTVFDMERSGAGLTWDHFFPSKPRPWMISYVEDRDLWRHQLPDTRSINAYVSTLAYDFDVWDMADTHMSIRDAARAGDSVVNYIVKYVDDMKKLSSKIELDGHVVPVVNAPPSNISEIVGELSHGHPFAIGWHVNGQGKYVYSFRSRGEYDVSALAMRFGGGGHFHSAGAVTSKPIHILNRGEVKTVYIIIITIILVILTIWMGNVG